MEMDGMDALRKRLGALESRLGVSPGNGLRPMLLKAGIVALKAATDRIDAGGPGWAPNQSHTPILHKTGALIRSLSVGGPSNVDNIVDSSITTGTNLDYAQYLQTGTREHAAGTPLAGLRQGPRRYLHGGMPARPYLFIDDQVAQKIRDLFGTYVMTGES